MANTQTLRQTDKQTTLRVRAMQPNNYEINKNNIVIVASIIIRSTLRQSRPNKAGLKCPSVRTFVRTFVHPRKVSLISLKFGISVDVDE